MVQQTEWLSKQNDTASRTAFITVLEREPERNESKGGTDSKTIQIVVNRMSSGGSNVGRWRSRCFFPEPAKNVKVWKLSQVFITNSLEDRQYNF